MCGITGFWNLRSGLPADRDTLRAMTGTLAHRGPDDDGLHVAGSLGLGIRRLAVTDPQGGRQPMPNEDGSVYVVFNGAIYNHVELRQELTGRSHRFRTRCDTEAIVHAWEEWGPRCVEQFNGMFAFAVWDANRRELFLARDRLGIKPLYVWQGKEGVAFGSELKAVLRAPWVERTWDREALDDFLTWEYVPSPRSIIEGVQKLPPASTLLFRESHAATHVAPQRYWSLQSGTGPVPDENMLREQLRKSVRRRLMADVPLGAFLSGGIDSSIIVGLMAREAGPGVRTFSVGFNDPSYNELPYASEVARRNGTSHYEEQLTPDVTDLAGLLADAYDEPFGDVSAFPTWLISSVARRHVTVALSGDGGDELFAGYDHYRAHRWADRIRWLTRTAGWRLVDSIVDGLPPQPQKKGALNKVKRFVHGASQPEDLEHARWLVFQDVAERRALYTPEAHERIAGRDIFEHYRALLAQGSEQGFTGLDRQLFADIHGYLPDDILTKVDRASMAVSLEVRVPFLDHEFVELAMRVPATQKLQGSTTKWILRRAFADVLPASVKQRQKEGFSIPMKQWLAGPLEPLMRDLLSRERLNSRGLFQAGEVERLMAEHVAGRRNHAHRLWCLMALELSLSSLERHSAGVK